MKATVFTPAFFIFSTTPATISGKGCDTVTVQAPRRPAMVTGVGEISGTLSLPRDRGDRHGAGHARGADQHVDLVLDHQLARIAAGGGRVGCIVQHDQLDLAAGERRMLGQGRADALLVRNAERRHRAGERADEADLEVGGAAPARRPSDRRLRRRRVRAMRSERARSDMSEKEETGFARAAWDAASAGYSCHTRWRDRYGGASCTSFHWPFSSLTTTRERSSEP